jgi:integrase
LALTDTAIRNAKPQAKAYKMADGGGLYLEVRANGSKLWRYRYRIAAKENLFAIGEYTRPQRAGHVSLDAAREAMRQAKVLVRQGVHPAHHRKATVAHRIAENANTFEAVAREWIESKRAKWSPYYCSQVEKGFKADVFPQIGALPIKNVTAQHLLEILKRAEKRGAEVVAILLRQWCSAVFRYAAATLRADTDPAAALKGSVERPKVRHKKPLRQKDVHEFLVNLGKYGGFRTTVIALRLLLLLFVRPGELRTAEWSEFDLDASTWRIPAERMKMREAHIVPLSRQAVELLRELHSITGGSRFLFPNMRRPKTCMTATTMNRSLERMGYGGGRLSAHGFRATASTMLNELGYRPDVIERQLAHQPRNKTRASYNQAEYLAERTVMMQEWADLLDQLASGKGKGTLMRKTGTGD